METFHSLLARLDAAVPGDAYLGIAVQLRRRYSEDQDKLVEKILLLLDHREERYRIAGARLALEVGHCLRETRFIRIREKLVGGLKVTLGRSVLETAEWYRALGYLFCRVAPGDRTETAERYATLCAGNFFDSVPWGTEALPWFGGALIHERSRRLAVDNVMRRLGNLPVPDRIGRIWFNRLQRIFLDILGMQDLLSRLEPERRFELIRLCTAKVGPWGPLLQTGCDRSTPDLATSVVLWPGYLLNAISGYEDTNLLGRARMQYPLFVRLSVGPGSHEDRTQCLAELDRIRIIFAANEGEEESEAEAAEYVKLVMVALWNAWQRDAHMASSLRTFLPLVGNPGVRSIMSRMASID